jgi:hypothetical protein
MPYHKKTGHELVFIELKAKKRNLMSFKQESKGLRIGRQGDMYDLVGVDGVKISTNRVKLMFPKDYQEIGVEDFLLALLELFEWQVKKEH